MKELKTLKDIEYHENWSSKKGYDIIVNSNTLKQEAIKWVKDFKVSHYTRQDGIETIEDFIKHFFNLTEEDLEEKE
jgi:hypothetical protein